MGKVLELSGFREHKIAMEKEAVIFLASKKKKKKWKSSKYR